MIASQNQQTQVNFKLYVAGDGVFTRNAITNLKTLITDFNQISDNDLLTKVEVIDVTQAPSVALELSIFTTPTLVVSCSTQRFRFVGDLSSPQKIIEILGSERD